MIGAVGLAAVFMIGALPLGVASPPSSCPRPCRPSSGNPEATAPAVAPGCEQNPNDEGYYLFSRAAAWPE